MKTIYSTPDFEIIRFQLKDGVLADVVAASKPEQTDAGGGYTPTDPADPFSGM